MASNLKRFCTQSLYIYDKQKVNVLKAILPILIIIHHISNFGYGGVELIGASGDKVMYLFFAMSGFGLTISYIKKKEYIDGFLRRSLTKLFIPYFIALIVFVIYRYIEGIDQVALFKEQGLLSFVPTSWYIYILAYFYIFFFVVFKYIKSNNFIKVLLTCVLVIGYVIIAPHIGIERWRYFRCPAFCIGMFFALYDDIIRTKFIRWHLLLVLGILLLFFIQPRGHRFDPLIYPIALFCLMYVIKNIKETRIVKFISSISLEMFIIQFLPMYIVMDDLQITSTAIMISLVLLLDIILAYLMHLLVKQIAKHIQKYK